MSGDYSSRDHGRSRDHYGGRRDDRREDRRDRSDRTDDRRRHRRRSYSPHHRDRDDVESYASSRDYRAREREERYSSGRRDDMDWDRGDRGHRRRDREPRDRDRDRDRERDRGRDRGDMLMDMPDDRMGKRGRDRDGDRHRERRRSRTPTSMKRREPTPDLTDVVPILERKRRLTQWDIKPPGYENVTAEQAKLSGMFPLPGAPRQQSVDPSRLQAFMQPASPAVAHGGHHYTNNHEQPTQTNPPVALKPSNARQAKRLFVENIPASISEKELVQFFNLQLNGLNVIENVDPCLSANFASDRNMGMLEFKSPADTTVALALDGITTEDHDNAMTDDNTTETPSGLRLRRPKDYIVPTPEEAPRQEGVVSTEVPDSPNKICVSNIPPFIPEEPVTTLLGAFGELKSFIMAKDTSTDESRGIVFCEYADPNVTKTAVDHFNGMELGDKRLKVTFASIGLRQSSAMDLGVSAMSMFAKTTSDDLEAGRVLQLLNMVTADELISDEDYEEILEDVNDECNKFGKVLEVKIPRPSGPDSSQAPGVGKIFVKFSDEKSATAALKSLAGRKFSDRTVVTTYFSEENFEVNAW